MEVLTRLISAALHMINTQRTAQGRMQFFVCIFLCKSLQLISNETAEMLLNYRFSPADELIRPKYCME